MDDVWSEVVRQHVALRKALEQLRSLLDSDRTSFFMYMGTVLDFLVNVHAKLEDEDAFPALERACIQESEGGFQASFRNTLSRLSADHKLLETLGRTIVGRGKGFQDEVLRERFEQFAKTLVEHNSNEETLFEEAVERCGEPNVRSALNTSGRAAQIVGGYGEERYRQFMESAEKSW